jgi:hypothetical protein
VAKSEAAAGSLAGLPDQDAPPQLRRPCAGGLAAVSQTRAESCSASAARRAPFNEAGAATQNNLSDERREFYLRDRLTWMRFLGLGLGDAIPDANTIWTFREALTKTGAIERLFELSEQAKQRRRASAAGPGRFRSSSLSRSSLESPGTRMPARRTVRPSSSCNRSPSRQPICV